MKIKYKRLNLKSWMVKYANSVYPTDKSAETETFSPEKLEYFEKVYYPVASVYMSDGWYLESDGVISTCYFSVDNQQYNYPDTKVFDLELKHLNVKECPLSTESIKSVLTTCDRYPGLLTKDQKTFLNRVLIYISVKKTFSERKLSMRKRLKILQQQREGSVVRG